MPATIAHIAERVGVSKQAVSYALNNRAGKVSPETREKILQTAKRLNYRPNRRAQSFALKRSKIIGLVYGRPADYIERSNMVSAIVEQLAAIDHELLLIPARGPIDAWAHKLADGRVDGALVSHPCPVGLDTFVNEETLPAVFLNVSSTLPVAQIRFADRDGALALTEHLLEAGHRRIAYFATPKTHGTHYSDRDRLDGFRDAMAAAGVAESIVTVDRTLAYARTLARMNAADRPTAVVAYNEDEAKRLRDHLHGLGLECPRDLSLVSFREAPAYRSVPRGITCIETPIHDMVGAGLRLLMGAIESGRPVEPESLVLPERLIPGSSVRSLPSPDA